MQYTKQESPSYMVFSIECLSIDMLVLNQQYTCTIQNHVKPFTYLQHTKHAVLTLRAGTEEVVSNNTTGSTILTRVGLTECAF